MQPRFKARLNFFDGAHTCRAAQGGRRKQRQFACAGSSGGGAVAQRCAISEAALPAQDRRGSRRPKPTASAGGDITSSPTAIYITALARRCPYQLDGGSGYGKLTDSSACATSARSMAWFEAYPPILPQALNKIDSPTQIASSFLHGSNVRSVAMKYRLGREPPLYTRR